MRASTGGLCAVLRKAGSLQTVLRSVCDLRLQSQARKGNKRRRRSAGCCLQTVFVSFLFIPSSFISRDAQKLPLLKPEAFLSNFLPPEQPPQKLLG